MNSYDEIAEIFSSCRDLETESKGYMQGTSGVSGVSEFDIRVFQCSQTTNWSRKCDQPITL